jgi:ABC-2 type transport system ATP-binding protein
VYLHPAKDLVTNSLSNTHINLETIIRTENLSKNFGPVKAVKDLSLHIRKGEIYGFLGLNGAGKTTTIRMLLGMIKPSSGTAFIKDSGVSAGNQALWAQVGSLVEVPYSYPGLTVRENLEIARRLRLLPHGKQVDEVMEKLQLTRYANRKAGHLSQGNAQRLGLAKALIHQPDILLLDEPSNSLDPAGIVEIRELLVNMAKSDGVTIFISSHILAEISRFATRIGIIHEGSLIREVDTDKLDQYCNKHLLLDAVNRDAMKNLFTSKGIVLEESGEECLQTAEAFAVAHPDEIATMMVQAGIPPTLLKVEKEDLESFFLRVIGNKGGEQ